MIKLIRDSFLKACLVTIFFAIVHLLYNIEFVRSNIEDIGFDITNKMILETREQNTSSPKVILFGFDDIYMKNEGLFDEDNKTNYGYIFPRDKIAKFINDIDELCQEIEPENIPKALFIDYDFSYTSIPYGKELSKEDKILINVLKKERPYVVLLPKTETGNFIEQSKDKNIQKLIVEQKIIFVSVVFLTSSDGATRRYLSYKTYKNNRKKKLYLNVDIALWQLARNNTVDVSLAQEQFMKHDIVSNRFFLKSYKNKSIEDSCQTSQSYWSNYIMYSAYCSIFDIVEEDFAGSILMLGGTYSENIDDFKILDVVGDSRLKGVELHANTLMSIFHLDRQLMLLKFWPSIILVFSLFFLINLLIGFIFLLYFIDNKKLHFIIVLTVTVAIMITISIYLLISKSIWFNWFVPVVIYEIFDILSHIKLKIDRFQKRKSDEIIST